MLEKTITGFFWIKRYKGGETSDFVKGLFTSAQEAEARLISYLRNTDKMNRAWWPGKKNPRMDLPYGPSVSE